MKISASFISRLPYQLALFSSFMFMIAGCSSPITTPTVALSPISLPTSTIESSPSSSGYWLAFIDDNHLYAVNKDGTGLTSLISGQSIWQFSSSPRENTMAVLISKKDKLAVEIALINIPQGDILREIRLLSFYDNLSTSFDDGPTGPLNGIMGDGPSSGIKWSPNGRYIAFMGAIDNSLSSLYIYDTELRVLKRLSQNNYQAVNPNWSPDGKWIVYEEVSNFHDWQTEGIWAASVDGELKLLYKPANRVEQEVLGWVEKGDFVVADKGMDGQRDIRIVNVVSGNIKVLYSGYYITAAISKNGAVAFFPLTGAPGSELDSGLYLISSDNSVPKLIIQPDGPFNANLFWDSPTESFISEIPCKNEPTKTTGFDSSGNILCLSNPMPNVSPNRDWYIINNEQLGVYQSDGEKLGVLPESNAKVIWSPDSDGFFIVANNELYHASIPGLDLQSVYKSKNGYFSFVWVAVH